MPPALLTPPVSPRSHPSSLNTSKESLQATTELLDFLIEYYHRKRLWTHHLRQTALRDHDSACESNNADHKDTASIRPPPNLTTASQRQTLTTPGSRCQRRRDVRKVGRRVPSRAERERIVDQFEELVATRLENCQRLNRLVRNANRARLIDDLQWTR